MTTSGDSSSIQTRDGVHRSCSCRRRAVWGTIVLFLAGFVAFNIVAYNQAYTMTHFTDGGAKTAKPEAQKGLGKLKILLTGVNIPKPTNSSKPSDFGLKYETHRIAVNKDVELEAWYMPCGEDAKGLVLLFHGYDSCKDKLLKETQAFHDLGYSTFLVDFRGSGGSNQRVTSIGVFEADDLIKSVEYAGKLRASNQPMILFGDSMGAAAILRAVATGGIKPDAIILEGVFDRLLSAVRNRFHSMGVPAFPAAEFLTFWGGVQFGFNGFRHNPVEYASKVKCPVLMLHGTDDPRATLEQARAVFDRLSGKKAFESFPAVKHESCLVAHPERWKSVVQAFLSGPR
jgi:uncharacterized protein